ncbi:MAG: type I glyceraldehyde-3-phosphate dehydrogenase [Candidatus Marinimicrobia bacterium]|nr:type I glyceraldehyde-3-phosphate dehydrogenase [Candidatus Neomarinimicrobiota bacterium]|tara:strand:- start:454 stop:1455 length:1002 start_codon:yes stop_codon:yes gene_type:complete
MRIAINGFGRIGRSIYRIISSRTDHKIVAINDLSEAQSLRYLLKYDTVMGRFNGDVEIEQDFLLSPNQKVKILREPEPAKLPWSENEVDIVIESTGIFRTKEQIQKHIDSGAKKVILTVPSKDEIDYTVVLGVNENGINSNHNIISNASCTTNCLAPMAKIINDNFGIVKGVMNTIHAYTNDQRLADVPHKDLRRSRAAAENIIPTSTGAAKAVGKVLPELEGKLDGIACRVPVPDGSAVDLFVELEKSIDIHSLNELVKHQSEKENLKNILEYSESPIVSSDIIGNSKSSIFDSSASHVIDGKYLRTLNWYDNEWGYSNRVVDLVNLLSKFI